MRKGLNPLSSYIAIATAAYAQQGAMGALYPDNAKPSQEALEKMLAGVQAYYQHGYKVERTPLETVWRAGEATLRSVGDADLAEDAPILVLIPSLINRSDILDLMPERSMLRWFLSQGVRCYLLDWGDSTADDGQADMHGVIMERLAPALQYLAQHHGQAVHALGYCMGGTLLVGAASQMEEGLASIISLAAPWDFHAGGAELLNRIKFWAPSAAPAIAEKGVLPVEWLQTLFASMDPTTMIDKFAHFADLDPESEQAKRFIAVEDWLNDGLSLPAAVAQDCIGGWFIQNKPVRGEWMLKDRTVHPEDIDCPVLIIASSKDRLVDEKSAAALQDQVKKSTLLNPECGHIGMIAGRHSVARVWQPIADWVHKHS